MAMIPVNMEGSKPAVRFRPIPGDYCLEVASCEISTNKDGQTQRLSVKNKILMGPGTSTEAQGKYIYSSYNLDPKNKDYLHTFIAACGLWPTVQQNGGAIDSDWFLGRQYYARVTMKGAYPNVSEERSTQAAAPSTGAMPQTAAQPSMLQPVQPMMPQQPQPQPQQYVQQYVQQPQQGFPQPQQFQPQQFQPQQGFPQQGGNGQGFQPQVPPPPGGFMAPPPPPGFAGQK